MAQREIRFRAWDGTTMFDVAQITFNDSLWSCDKGRGVSIKYQPHIELMQYTGLKDKNGKEIYDRDIISYTFDSLLLKGEIHWNSYCGEWQYKYMGANNHTVTDNLWLLLSNTRFPKNVTVIGNIYENPELIGK